MNTLDTKEGIRFMEKKLFRATKDKKIFGVCGGLARYFGCDATLIRLIAVVLAVIYGSGVLLYLLAALIMPTTEEY